MTTILTKQILPMQKHLLAVMAAIILAPAALRAQEQQSLIEFHGDCYTINVDALQPDREMTLMDVLMTCSELLSNNGKNIALDYELYVDNIPLNISDETLLQAVKAQEISTIDIYAHTPVVVGGGGRSAIIDIYFKEQDEGRTNGKLMLTGSTRGNGSAYADVVTRQGDVTVRGYAMTNLQYARGESFDQQHYTARQGQENVHLNVDWNLGERDNLKIKLNQCFQDSKVRRQDAETLLTIPELSRYWSGVASYTHDFNDRGASLTAEGGADWLKTTDENQKLQDCFAYCLTEFNVPCLNDDLNIYGGWEIDYYNTWNVGMDRQQMMFNDVYLQLDYTRGPWMLTVGDRLRFVNYWHRDYEAYSPLWNHARTENSFMAAIGYKTGRHFIQATLIGDYQVPTLDDIYAGYDHDHDRWMYRTELNTHKYWSLLARYAYQRPSLTVSTHVLHSWTRNSPSLDEQYTGAGAAVTWWKGAFRLTAGADYYHQYVSTLDDADNEHYNIFDLRLLPSVVLGGGLRLGAMLMYASRRSLTDPASPHLYASVKATKDLGRYVTLSLDCHDLAGTPRIMSYRVGESFDDRAVTLGLTWRF